MSLNAYMGYSRNMGPSEGAVLIFAHTAREAKRVGMRSVLSDITGGDFLDMAIRRIREPGVERHGDAEKLARDEPHMNDSPNGCCDCECWFAAPYDAAGRCESCAELAADNEDAFEAYRRGATVEKSG